MSKQINNYVQAKLEAFYQNKIAELLESVKKLPIALEAYQHRVPQHELKLATDLANAVNSTNSWFVKNESLIVMISHKNINYEFMCEFSDPKYYIPYNMCQRGYNAQGRAALPITAPSYGKVITLLDEVEELKTKQRAISHTIIKEVLEKCITLKQVLEIWPTALDFMPKEIREAHERVVLPKKRATQHATQRIIEAIDTTTKVELIKMRLSTQ